MTDVIRSIKDLPASIEPGTGFFVDVWPEEPAVDPAEFEKIERLEADILAAIAERSAPPVPIVDAPTNPDPKLDVLVAFTDTHLVVTSPDDRTVTVSGDVADSKAWKLKSGKPSKRKLTKEGTGVVIIDGVSYPTPQAPAKGKDKQ